MTARDSLPWGPPWARGRAHWGYAGPPPAARVLFVLVAALVQVGGTFGAAHGQPDRRPVDALGVCLLLVGPAALAFLSKRPRGVVVVVAAATGVFLGLGYPYGPVYLSLAVSLVAAVVGGHRGTAWLAGLAVVAADGSGRLLGGRSAWSWAALAGELAWLLVILSVGELVRGRAERAASFRQAAQERRRRQAGEERLRIAQELHDVVAHHMSLINVQAGVALHLADRRPEAVEPALRAIRDASKEALTELRSLVDVLRDPDRPAPLSPVGTLSALDDMVERAGHAGLQVRKTVEGTARSVPAAVELAATRIVQEAVTNVVRHAGAHHAEVRLLYGDGVLGVRVDDDGDGGVTDSESSVGNGIRGMRERAAALGGTLRLAASPLGGTRVDAVLPTGPGPGEDTVGRTP
ncbi:sensor histidine kinase [Phycicoccus sp. M110.8]|uniref:sensor histidine kinase n=1 Tax=Phycicoccus sp. M110.8 TaxID=3075433 RepID=UPI0028FD3BC2|nr:sensor histidine kinase [Phycicoccus sp. M110.8]MDU0313951.1 sensor histidine kinase [Phycicoccus sp. M110.8]